MSTETTLDLGALAAQVHGERFTSLTGRVVPYDVWEHLGLFEERIVRGAFTESLARNPAVPLLLWHRADAIPVGVADDWADKADGLYGRFRLDTTPVAQEAARAARDTFLTGLSVGFVAQRSTWEPHPAWDPEQGHVDRVTRDRARLTEVSLTPTPAYTGARVTDVEAIALRGGVPTQLRRAQAWRRAYQHLHGL